MWESGTALKAGGKMSDMTTYAAGIQQLLGLGFSETESAEAFNAVGVDVAAAVEWLFSKRERGDQTSDPSVSLASFADSPRLKMVFLVRQDLGMGTGKVAAQVGHATLGTYKLAMTMNPLAVHQWEADGGPKIVLRVKDQTELLDLVEKARGLSIPVCTIRDAGHTQVEPGSLTVCGIGPAPEDQLNAVTGHLKLL
eukprot:GILJ01001256.1.p1 GENE.GILJ01001256.1~~GILJ01001256.1.p1  ORF type:complete len:196 (+),score=21.03 GILJ01001256.1:2-589(+)